MEASRSGAQPSAFALVGAEAQQRGDVSGAVELGIVLHIYQFRVATNDRRYDRIGNVGNFAGLAAAGRTKLDHVRVDVTTGNALRRQMRKLFADEQRLHFAQLQRAQNAAQSGHAVAITLGLTDRFRSKFVATLVERLLHDAAGMFSNLFVRHLADVRREAAQHSLFHIGMQLSFKFAPAFLVTADDQLLKPSLLESFAQMLRYVFEMVQGLVIDATLGVACVISVVSVAPALPSRKSGETCPHAL